MKGNADLRLLCGCVLYFPKIYGCLNVYTVFSYDRISYIYIAYIVFLHKYVRL